ncbi:hypothetical protein HX017_10305 [Myroides marinus]|uniref:DUF6427 family protein n=1 Tax=Myroides marinus TaxID=703342 RepID=UPI002576F4F3|nr:DUF6427 family protein [Myroides marinus]MDM1348013.1 hypothetical protein [Myroides marinus]MDM1350738.1 hypothetical protein [Myroides marinus]MDM1354526.1 hypothetical protein [Myroides marinus]MDM1357945.1 hypothetical protein [Myroides marinus]MDM1365338.1 hypothetical protein [Myroides marinus]
MLASIFSKTKPINYIILTILILMISVLYLFIDQDQLVWTSYEFGKRTVLLGLLMVMMFLSQFVVTRNRLVRDNAYVPLLFVSFLMFFPTVLVHSKVIISNYFIMLALRRIFALHSLKQSKEKIFDTSLWIFVASLFHFWSVLFFILLFFAITFFGSKDYRNWFIPIIAFFCVSIFLELYLIMANESYYDWFWDKCRVSFDFMYFENIYQNISLAVFVPIALLFFVSQALTVSSKPFNMQGTYKKIILSFLIGVAIYIVSADKNNGTLLFTFFPLAVLGANYIESIPQRWRREAVVYSVFGLGVFFYIMQLIL